MATDCRIPLAMYSVHDFLMLFFLSGSRFSYTVYDKSCGPIYKSIEALDRKVIYDLNVKITIFYIELSLSLTRCLLSNELQKVC